MRTKAQIHDLEDRGPESAGRAPTTDGLGGFVFQDAGGGHLTGTMVVLDDGAFIGVFDEIRFIGSGVQAFNSGSYGAVAVTGSAAAPGPGGGSGAMIAPLHLGLQNSTAVQYTATPATWFNIRGCTGTFVVDRQCDVIITYDCRIRGATNNWEYLNQRLIFDGGEIGSWQKQRSNNPLWTEIMMVSMHWLIQGVASGTHGFEVQVLDSSSHSDPVLYVTNVEVISPNGGTRWVETGI